MTAPRRTALVTGAGSGIGAASARRLAAAGHRVILGDVDRAAGEAVADELGPPHRAVVLDVADPDAWDAIVNGLDAPLDVLHLNAGIMSPSAPSSEIAALLDPDALRTVFGVNVAGVVHGLRAALPALRAAEQSSVVATGSTASIWGFAGDPLYAASKFAVVGLVASVAPLLAKEGVTLTCVCPGSTVSGLVPEAGRVAAPDGTLRSLRTGKILQPAERLADFVHYLVGNGRPGEVWVVEPDNEPWRVAMTVTGLPAIDPQEV